MKKTLTILTLLGLGIIGLAAPTQVSADDGGPVGVRHHRHRHHRIVHVRHHRHHHVTSQQQVQFGNVA